MAEGVPKIRSRPETDLGEKPRAHISVLAALCPEVRPTTQPFPHQAD